MKSIIPSERPIPYETFVEALDEAEMPENVKKASILRADDVSYDGDIDHFPPWDIALYVEFSLAGKRYVETYPFEAVHVVNEKDHIRERIETLLEGVSYDI